MLLRLFHGLSYRSCPDFDAYAKLRKPRVRYGFCQLYTVGEASSSVLDHAKACAEAISKEAMSEGDVDAVTKDTGYGRVLGEIIRDWGVACAKRRAECLHPALRAGVLSQLYRRNPAAAIGSL